MLDVCLLGTGGMMPLPDRWLTSLMTRYNGSSILIDCGEGTQIAVKEKGWSFKDIDLICITHYHADHISGLPGVLLAMANSDRTEPVRIVGPKGLGRVVNSLRVIAAELPFPLQVTEHEGDFCAYSMHGCRIEAFRVQHNLCCYGYSISVKRSGKFDVERAKSAGIPLQFWNPLQKGATIRDGDHVYTPDMVLGAERKGLKVTYVTDTRPVAVIADRAEGADLFICEGMYGEPEKAVKAAEYKHMMMQDAAKLALAAGVSELWLTHFSPSLVNPERYMKDVRTIFPNALPGRDGLTKELNFEDGDPEL